MSVSVEEHYASDGIVARLLAAVEHDGSTHGTLRAQDLYPFDQFHGRELLATRDHGARLAPGRTDHVLDIGSGIGGPARYLAATFGCRVTGVDLTPRFVEAASELTALCSLDALVGFVRADAAALPFEANTFDHAICFYVGMNLPDKAAVLSEAARVLKPGGRLIWTEVVSRNDPPHYPLPWAISADMSHLTDRDSLVGLVAAAKFKVLAVEDETDKHLELAEKMRQSAKVPSPHHQQANAVVLGPDFVERRTNYIRSLAEARLASLFIEAAKPI